jgi:N-acetylglutamate synthase-like GNAT family acetyltransferase
MLEVTVEVTNDRVDLDVIHRYLSEESYWAKGIPRALVERAIANSLCFGAFDGEAQVGFARVVTDYATFGYVADVFVLPAHRGRGIAKALMRVVREHPELQSLRRWHLITRDAHGLYAQFGFAPLEAPQRHMGIAVPNAYA